jgi:hypothetical protein
MWLDTDVSGLLLGILTLEDGADSLETSVSNRLTPRDNPEDGRIRLKSLLEDRRAPWNPMSCVETTGRRSLQMNAEVERFNLCRPVTT